MTTSNVVPLVPHPLDCRRGHGFKYNEPEDGSWFGPTCPDCAHEDFEWGCRIGDQLADEDAAQARARFRVIAIPAQERHSSETQVTG